MTTIALKRGRFGCIAEIRGIVHGHSSPTVDLSGDVKSNASSMDPLSGIYDKLSCIQQAPIQRLPARRTQKKSDRYHGPILVWRIAYSSDASAIQVVNLLQQKQIRPCAKPTKSDFHLPAPHLPIHHPIPHQAIKRMAERGGPVLLKNKVTHPGKTIASNGRQP